MPRLTIVHRHFWPSDLPYAMMLREFALEAKKSSYDVTIVAPVQNVADQELRAAWSKDSGITHISKVLASAQGAGLVTKMILYIRYLIWVTVVLIRQRSDVIWVATTPPVIAAAIVRYISAVKKCAYVYHVQDIHPEASTAIGKVEQGMLFRALRRIDASNVKSASCVVTLSSDMKSTLLRRGTDDANIVVINNFVRSNIASVGEGHHRKKPDSLVPDKTKGWIFAGTIGYFQNIELFMDAVQLIEPEYRPHITLLGSGSLKTKLMHKYSDVGKEFIEFMDPVDSVEAQRLMSEHAVGIVSLGDGVIDCAYPSKLVNYLSAGLQIIAVVSPESDLARLLEQEAVGYAAYASDAPALAVKIKKAIVDGKLEENRAASIEVSRKHFSSSVALGSYINVLHSVTPPLDKVV